MNSSLYGRAQQAIAELKGVVFELIEQHPEGLTNAEIGRQLGIYKGHVGHEGHMSRTILSMLQSEEVVVQDKETKVWTIRRTSKLSSES